MARRNECVNPAAAVNVSGWLNSGASGAPTPVTGLTGMDRTTGARATNTAAGSAALLAPVYQPGGTLNGTTWTFRLTARVSVSASMSAYLALYDSGGTAVAEQVLSTVSRTANTAWSETVTYTVASSTHFGFQIGVVSAASVASGTQLTISGVRFEQVNDPAMVYADGDTPGWTWVGTAGASASVEAAKVGQMFLGAS